MLNMSEDATGYVVERGEQYGHAYAERNPHLGIWQWAGSLTYATVLTLEAAKLLRQHLQDREPELQAEYFARFEQQIPLAQIRVLEDPLCRRPYPLASAAILKEVELIEVERRR